MDGDRQNKINELEQEIRNLQSKLTSSNSPIGDWKVAKCMEYQVMGLDSPYDMEELHTARQAVRDEINAIQEEISNLSKITVE